MQTSQKTQAGRGCSLPQKHHRTKSNPIDNVEDMAYSSKTQTNYRLGNDKPAKRVSNVLFSFPEIVTPPPTTQQSNQDDKFQAYFSARLSPSTHQKTSKDISDRYYKQIEILKEVSPRKSQKVFTITQMHNKDLSGVHVKGRQRNLYNLTPSSVLDKYQIVREKEKEKERVLVPYELLTKQYTSSCVTEERGRNSKGSSPSKDKVRFKFNSNSKYDRQTRRKFNPQAQGIFQLEGWKDERGENFHY